MSRIPDEAYVYEQAGRKTVSDLNDTVAREAEFSLKAEKYNVGTLRRFINRIKLLFRMIGDYKRGYYRELPWTTIAMAITAIISGILIRGKIN